LMTEEKVGKLPSEKTVRFRDFPKDDSRKSFIKILEFCFSRSFVEVDEENELVDVEITGPYGGLSDSYKTPLMKKTARAIYSRTTRGKHLSKPNLATGITPSSLAKFNLWYTGENQRPPYGNWDAYLSFDCKIAPARNFYLPLWLLTSTDWILDLEYSYWGSPKPKLSELFQKRDLGNSKSKFACAFIGKNYPVRLHAIEALRKIGKVDVFGEGARNPVKNPSEVARDYKFVMCFENDLYPGYVTEKPVEAYLSGAIPLYYGMDEMKYLNNESMINLNDFDSMEGWLDQIAAHNTNNSTYIYTHSQPLLKKAPELSDLIAFLRRRLGIA